MSSDLRYTCIRADHNRESNACPLCLREARAERDEYKRAHGRLQTAVEKLYYAAVWVPSDDGVKHRQDGWELWQELRDAAGLPPGGTRENEDEQ